VLDLVVLSADIDIEASIKAVIGRPHAVGIRQVTVEYVRHPGHDPGVFTTARQLLASYRDAGTHALAVLDCAWEGNPCEGADEVQMKVATDLAADWGTAAAAIAIEPEVEVWLWSPSPHVAKSMGWNGTTDELRRWLESQELWQADHLKPHDPKEAFERACRRSRTVPSSSVFGSVLSKVSLTSCTDPAFLRMVKVLQAWFPQEQ
jgi:hypothetical protein